MNSAFSHTRAHAGTLVLRITEVITKYPCFNSGHRIAATYVRQTLHPTGTLFPILIISHFTSSPEPDGRLWRKNFEIHRESAIVIAARSCLHLWLQRRYLPPGGSVKRVIARLEISAVRIPTSLNLARSSKATHSSATNLSGSSRVLSLRSELIPAILRPDTSPRVYGIRDFIDVTLPEGVSHVRDPRRRR